MSEPKKPFDFTTHFDALLSAIRKGAFIPTKEVKEEVNRLLDEYIDARVDFKLGALDAWIDARIAERVKPNAIKRVSDGVVNV